MIYEGFATSNMGFTLAFILFVVGIEVYLLYKLLNQKIEDNK